MFGTSQIFVAFESRDLPEVEMALAPNQIPNSKRSQCYSNYPNPNPNPDPNQLITDS